MSDSALILPSRAERRARRTTALFTATATLTFAVTGIGLFEGHVVYPSWYDLAVHDGFASYHSAFGQRLIPWLPVPLAAATILNGLMLRRRPPAVPRALVLTTFVLQLGIGAVTAALAIPLQTELSTPGHTPEEIAGLLDQLVRVSWLRDVPGVVIALAFAWMLNRQLGDHHDPVTGPGVSQYRNLSRALRRFTRAGTSS